MSVKCVCLCLPSLLLCLELCDIFLNARGGGVREEPGQDVRQDCLAFAQRPRWAVTTVRRRRPPPQARVGRGRIARLGAGASVAVLSRRQYCAPLSKSQMEQHVFFHLAALKVKEPRATCGKQLRGAVL